MPLAPGTRLGGYEIVSLLGAGGMGEVYRGRDTRLDRDVAIKVLPGGASTDSDRLQRFEQEARATAALNHPHILAVYDVGAEGSVHYVVSELLEGESLRTALERGALPPRKAIEYGAQIARGLAAAHERHIVHRDLKPDNIFLTREGRAKILDFGLARILHTSEPGDRTMTGGPAAGTSPGMVLGTMGYMSPEQVRGLAVDHRSDIFSFGAVLYEMIAGKRAFHGATPADTMSAILSGDPPEFESAARHIPPILDRLVRRCLEKSPDERYQSARDLAFNLEALSTISPGDTTSATVAASAAASLPAARGRSRAWLPAAFGLLVGLLAGGAAVLWTGAGSGTPTASPSYRQLTFRRGMVTSARFSPDGQSVVYAAEWEGRPSGLYTARVDSIGEQPLSAEGQIEDISASGEVALLTDVQRIVSFMTRGTLARMPLAGGAPRAVVQDVGSASWGPDGQQLAIMRSMPNRRWSLEFPVGTVLYDAATWIEEPRVSADGTRVAFFEHPGVGGDNRGHVSVVTLSGDKTDVSGDYASLVGLAWHPNGELWFSASAEGVLMQLFAVRPGETVRSVAALPASVVLQDVRPDGSVLLETQSRKVRMLVKVPGEEEERDIGWFDYPLLRDMSADGKYILFDEEGQGGGPGYSVFMRPTSGGPAVRLGDGYANAFAPDLQHVLTSGPGRGLRIVPTGPGESREVSAPATNVVPAGPARWWVDSRRLLVAGRVPGAPARTFLYDPDSRESTPLTPEGVTGTLVSPDGRMLLVTAKEQRQLFTIDGGAMLDIKGLTAADQVVRWSGDGRALFVSRQLSVRQRDLARLDLATGRREVIATFGPTDGAGVALVAAPVVSADGKTHAYRYQQLLSDLFIATGLK